MCVTGNELADCLAKEGAKQTPFGPLPFLPLSPSAINNIIMSSFKSKWQKLWTGLSSCRQTKLFSPQINPIVAKEIRLLNRTDAGRVIQFLTGHVTLSRHLVVMGLVEHPTCRLCQEPDVLETPYHLIAECPALEMDRRMIFTKEGPRAWLRQISQFILLPKIQKLLQFQTENDDFDNSLD